MLRKNRHIVIVELWHIIAEVKEYGLVAKEKEMNTFLRRGFTW